MKRILVVVFLLIAAAAFAANSPVPKKFLPTERIPADTAVSFPVDI